MAFQFTRWNNEEIAKVSFELPSMPYGVGYHLKKDIDAYCDALRNIADNEDRIEELFAAVAAHEAKTLPDTIAKFLIQLHHDNSGLDGETLLLVPPSDCPGALAGAEAILSDLYRQLPQSWDAAFKVYRDAVMVENDYDRRVWNPGYEAGRNGGEGNSKAVEDEMERLQEIRWTAEYVLLSIPAPTLTEFAVKYLICFDRDRDNNGWHEELCAEAKRLLQINDNPEATELETLLATLDWRSAQ